MKRLQYQPGQLIALVIAIGCLAWPGISRAATLRVEPSTGSYVVGQQVTVTVMVDAEHQAMNAAEATVTWDGNQLTYQSATKTRTLFQYWAVEPVQRDQSTLFFSGGLPDPGYSGSDGIILQVHLVARQAGTSTIQLTGGKVLANDGTATNLAVTTAPATVVVINDGSSQLTATQHPSPTITSGNYGNQQSWYADPVANLSWTQPAGSSGFSYSLSTSAATEPPATTNVSGRSMALPLPTDGIWYFHLRAKYDDGWSVSSTYVLHADRTAPVPFTPLIIQDRGPSDPTTELRFQTTDDTSGIGSYAMSVDGGRAQPVTSPYLFEGLLDGTHDVAITAVDQAGNSQVGKAIFSTSGYPPPKILNLTSTILLLDALTVRGTANAGDAVNIYINQKLVITTVVGSSITPLPTSGVVRVPWVMTLDRQLSPGSYQLTATATSSTGQVSVMTDPIPFRVSGQAVRIHGRSIATISVVAPVAVLLLSLSALIVSIMARLMLAIVFMHRHVRSAEDDVERLRAVNQRQGLSRQQLDTALEQIEEDLEGGGPEEGAKDSPPTTQEKPIMTVWIVLPTYNEIDNIQQTILDIRRSVEAEILVVDDNSPDGTGKYLDQLVEQDVRLHVMHRSEKRGLGSAYQEGFRFALNHGAEVVIQMDADGSHDPTVLPNILQQLTTADLVLASRYVSGGSFPIVWYRRWISTIGNVYIRMLLGWRIHDWSTGYKGWRRPFLERVMAQPSRGVGYAWLMEMTWIARQLGGRITEVPLVFLERRGGLSKFNWRIAWEDITLAWGLARRGSLATETKT